MTTTGEVAAVGADERSARRRTTDAWWWAIPGALVAAAVFYVAHRGLVDDAYITLSYARNVAEHLHWGMIPAVESNTATSPLNVMMLAVATLGSVMSSTGVVAIFIPIVMGIAARLRINPGRLMMPLAFAGLISGMLTLVETPQNVVVHSDLNCLSVIQFAVDVLKIRHIIVCGHYGCGGVTAAMRDDKLGLIDNWLRHVQDVRNRNRDELGRLEDEHARMLRLCELNVLSQAINVPRRSVMPSSTARPSSVVRIDSVICSRARWLRNCCSSAADCSRSRSVASALAIACAAKLA